MSRIGKKPVKIPAGVTIEMNGNQIKVKGTKGELKKSLNELVKVEVKGDEIIVTRESNEKRDRAIHGLTRILISNMIEGVTKGYSKQLEIVGVGYRAKVNKNKISLSLGYSHPIDYTAPQDIEFEMNEEKKNLITIKGPDKQTVGEVAAKVRSFRPPEPYKGKGIKYIDEHIERKAGKAAATAGAGASK